MPYNISAVTAEDEPCSPQSARIEKRIIFADTFFQLRVSVGVFHFGYLKVNMKPRPRRNAPLNFHVIAAVCNSVFHIGELVFKCVGSYPFVRIIGVVIIAVHRNTLRGQKLIVCPVMVLIHSADVVKLHSFFQLIGGSRRDFIRINAVCANALNI